MGTGGVGQVPHLLLLHLLLQLTEVLTGRRSAPQEGPGDPPEGVLVTHQVSPDALACVLYLCYTISAVHTAAVTGPPDPLLQLCSMSASEVCD